MNRRSFPFPLPPVLAAYLETFPSEPEKSIARLEGLLKRRGNDPLSFLLLAWMNEERGNRELAVRFAQTAAVFAPGSPVAKLAPYYFQHPDFFKAPSTGFVPSVSSDRKHLTPETISISDLDSLIEQLTHPDVARIPFSQDYHNESDLSVNTLETADDIASETLAAILVKQGKWADAIAMYRLLDGDSGLYEQEISDLQNRLKN